METDRLQYNSSSSPSLPPPQIPFNSFLGSLVTLISKIDIRYEGVLFHINPNDATLGLCNVICYGTEGRNNDNNRLQIPPVNAVFQTIIFTGNHIKEMLVKPSANCGYYYRFGLAKGATTITNKPNYAAKPPLPRILSSPSASSNKMMRQKIPIIKPQASDDNTDSNNALNSSLARPQYPDLSFNDHWSYHHHGNNNNQSMPYNGLPLNHQAVTNTSYASNELMAPATNSLQSVFTTFPPAPISLQQIPGVFNFGTVNQNFEDYKMWNILPKKEKDTKPSYNIDGSYYKKSRLPFDDIGKPYNPFGPIARPPWKQEPSIDWSYDLKPPPSNYRGWIY